MLKNLTIVVGLVAGLSACAAPYGSTGYGNTGYGYNEPAQNAPPISETHAYAREPVRRRRRVVRGKAAQWVGTAAYGGCRLSGEPAMPAYVAGARC